VDSSTYALVAHLCSVFSRRPGEPEDDRELLHELLHRFAQAGDGDAFAALMRRHGPMVLGLARRCVDDWQTAEDVFQAAFLVLAHKVHTIRRPESLPCWLHSITFRLARQARQSLARRREHEPHARLSEPPTPLDELTAREWLSVLDEELNDLPEPLRAPLILCCLEGLSQEEAAKRLGCSAAAVRGRLERGRNRLRQRLEKRGLLLPAVLGGSLLINPSARAVPPALADSTLNAARTGTGATPAASALAREVLQGMLVNRMRLLAVAVLLAIVGSALGLTGLRRVAREEAVGTTVAAGDDRPAAGSAALPKQDKEQPAEPLPPGAVLRLGTLRQRAVGAVLAVSADGQSIVSVRGGKVIRIWDAATGELRQTRELPGEAWSIVNLSPDGRWMLRTSGSPREHLEVWNVQTGAKARTLTIEGSRYIMPAAFSTDGKRVAAVGHRRVEGVPGHLDDHLVRTWDLATGKELFAANVRNNVATSLLAFSPDGKRLLATFSSVEEGMYCWDIATGRRLWKNKEFGHSGIVFTPDGKILSSQQRPRAVDLETGLEADIPGLPAFEWDTHLHLTPDGQTLLLANNQGVRIWDLKQGKELGMLKRAGEQVVVMPDGRSIITNSGVLQRWDLATGEPLLERRQRAAMGRDDGQATARLARPRGQTAHPGLALCGSGRENARHLGRRAARRVGRQRRVHQALGHRLGHRNSHHPAPPAREPRGGTARLPGADQPRRQAGGRLLRPARRVRGGRPTDAEVDRQVRCLGRRDGRTAGDPPDGAGRKQRHSLPRRRRPAHRRRTAGRAILPRNRPAPGRGARGVGCVLARWRPGNRRR
jgi:RNA polymerase sigma factor (sigma-70 family)